MPERKPPPSTDPRHMPLRNPKRRPTGVIDCEIKHPTEGWMPYTARDDWETTKPVFDRLEAGEAGEVLDEDFPQPSYEVRRAREYPSLRDQMDALWKGGEAEDEMRRKIMAVKARHPKPEEDPDGAGTSTA